MIINYAAITPKIDKIRLEKELKTMKPILINEKNAEKITAIINEVEKRATTRLVKYIDIVKAINTIKNELGIPAKYYDGIKASINLHKEQYPSAYKYRPMGTCFDVEARKGKWYLTAVYRSNCDGSPNTRFRLSLPELAKQKIIERMEEF